MSEREPRSRPEFQPRFALGQVVGTPGALEPLQEAEEDPLWLPARHVIGDWGELAEEDRAENEFSVNNNLRLLSAYTLATSVKIWLIAEEYEGLTLVCLGCGYCEY